MRLLISVILLLFTEEINAQKLVIEDENLLNFLSSKNYSVTSITSNNNSKYPFLHIDNDYLRNNGQVLLKNSKGLFILIDGSGRVYKNFTKDSNKIEFRRIDSTQFYGYNSATIFFSYNDTLFSFGGNGFWRRNGQLRYYDELSQEWNIEKIDKEIPTTDLIYFQDQKEKSISYLKWPFIDEATGTKFNNYIIIKLDLAKKQNKELGFLNKGISSLFLENPNYFFVNIPDLNGTFISFNRQNQYLINYNANEVYSLTNKNINDFLHGNSNGMKILNTFAIKDTVYYTKSNDSTYKLYSFPISMKDFVKEPYPLYEPFEDESKKTYLYIGGLFMLLIGGSVFFVKKRKQKTTSTSIEPTTTVFKKEDNGIDFNPLELELITKMIEQSARGNHFSVEDINTSLGLNRKTLEIQKKIRTETINRINHKFKIKYNLSIDLIERIRSEEDRRYYKYMISGENSKVIKN